MTIINNDDDEEKEREREREGEGTIRTYVVRRVGCT